MSLPIDAEAIAAQTKAEHEYGERLMDLAQERATRAGQDSVTAADVEWVAVQAMDAVDGRTWRLDPPLRCICAERLGAK